MQKFYFFLKLLYVVLAIILLGIMIPTAIYTLSSNLVTEFVVSIIAVIIICLIAAYILVYYRNLVINISFQNENTYIQTNCKTYCFPSTSFTEVIDDKWKGKVFLICKDGNNIKKFVFQKRYSPFRTHSLNFEEMREKMIFAKFREK